MYRNLLLNEKMLINVLNIVIYPPKIFKIFNKNIKTEKFFFNLILLDLSN